MYNINELSNRGGNACYAFGRLFFSIYYRTKDNAFQHASTTWKKSVKTQQAFVSTSDYFYEKGVTSECEFVSAWNKIEKKAKENSMKVWAGHLLTHASKQNNNNDGLEFISCGNEDGTFKQSEILTLPVLPWHKQGFLVLAGCRSGLKRNGWTPANTFAQRQKVTTLGQRGYSYFSTTWNSYTQKSDETYICLWAFSRGKNALLGSGKRITGSIFHG